MALAHKKLGLIACSLMVLSTQPASADALSNMMTSTAMPVKYTMAAVTPAITTSTGVYMQPVTAPATTTPPVTNITPVTAPAIISGLTMYTPPVASLVTQTPTMPITNGMAIKGSCQFFLDAEKTAKLNDDAATTLVDFAHKTYDDVIKKAQADVAALTADVLAKTTGLNAPKDALANDRANIKQLARAINQTIRAYNSSPSAYYKSKTMNLPLLPDSPSPEMVQARIGWLNAQNYTQFPDLDNLRQTLLAELGGFAPLFAALDNDYAAVEPNAADLAAAKTKLTEAMTVLKTAQDALQVSIDKKTATAAALAKAHAASTTYCPQFSTIKYIY